MSAILELPRAGTLLNDRSPLSYVDRIERPLLIGQGMNDVRVDHTESEQVVTTMAAKSIPVTYVAFNAVTEVFLSG